MKYIILSFIAVILTFIIISRMSKVPSIPEFKTVDRKPVYVGAWVGGFYSSKTRKLNPKKLLDFEKTLDSKMAIAHLFSEWTYLSDSNFITSLDEISNNGWVPMVSANPSFFEKCPKGDDNLYKTIANGSCDLFLKDVALNLKSYKKPIFLRFAWEMNLPEIYWSVDYVKSTPQDFKNAWIALHTAIKKNNANNVIMVFSYNTSGKKTIPYKDLYPGDDYVDWVAIDGYNWGNTKDWSKWLNFDDAFYNSYAELTSITSKPVMLSEFGSANDGGDKARWYDDTLNMQIPIDYPAIQAIVFFNENKFKSEGVDWRIETNPKTVDIVSQSLKRPMYLQRYTQ